LVSHEGAAADATAAVTARAAGLCLVVTLGAQISAPADAQREFLRGLAALHTFEYEEANDAFLTAQKLDPDFAMAYWGEAMTYHQTLWGNEDVAAAERILRRLGSTPAARAAKAQSPRDKGLLASLDLLFGSADAATRRAQYAKALEELYARQPDDPEVGTFYALALLGTVSRGLAAGDGAHEGHSAALPGSEIQTRVATVLERVLRAAPAHAGALHYLLHNYDDPEHARLALAAARRYASVAPQSSHALHMPAHIFLQLGLWRDAALSDRAAFAASDAWVKAKARPFALRNYHALSWLQYELLQRGRFAEAAQAVGEIAPVVKATGQLSLLSDFASMRARYVIETRRWEVMAGERNFANVNELCAIGFSAARSGDSARAEMARQALAERARAEQEGDMRPAIAIMEREVAALISLVAGRGDEALEILRAAAQAEQQLPPPLGPPKPIKPAPELLGEVLLELGRPQDARAAFLQALARNPNRTLSVLGLARAAKALGDAAAMREHYRAVLENYEEADADLSELAEAHREIREIKEF
jgi:tetratricopeptide (TPR) repeat protein